MERNEWKHVYHQLDFGLFINHPYLQNSDKLKPQDSFGRFVKICLDLQKVNHTIRKHH